MTSRRRRRFAQRVLAAWPLTQPPWRCQRCGYEDDEHGALQLDHMVELHAGGIDHPYNLLRLCDGCHDAKPVVDAMLPAWCRRLAVLEWVRTGWWWSNSQPQPLGSPFGTRWSDLMLGIRKRGVTWR